MTRRTRVWFPGAMYHVTARGNRKETIFRDKEDYLCYLRLLERAQKLFPFTLHSYCLMPNHIHLLLQTIEHSPSKIIHYIHSVYARYFNRKYNLIGHLFQDRFNGKLINDWKHMIDTSRYIHLNPVKAGLVSDPILYPWSSYKVYITSQTSSIVTTDKIIKQLSGGSKVSYKNYVEIIIKNEKFYKR